MRRVLQAHVSKEAHGCKFSLRMHRQGRAKGELPDKHYKPKSVQMVPRTEMS